MYAYIVLVLYLEFIKVEYTNLQGIKTHSAAKQRDGILSNSIHYWDSCDFPSRNPLQEKLEINCPLKKSNHKIIQSFGFMLHKTAGAVRTEFVIREVEIYGWSEYH